MSEKVDPLDISALATELIADLANHPGGRTAKSVIHGKQLRAVLMALAADASLADHDSPGPACLQVITGSVELRAGEESWPLTAGDLMSIPPVRHSVHASTDAAFLLTISLRP